MLADALEEYFTFANFRLYPRQRTLFYNDEPLALGARTFDILHLLTKRAGQIVSVDELMKFVWPNITVEEANLRVQMGVLRKALSRCEDARRAIETVPLRGYCFIIPVRHHSIGIEDHGGPALPLSITLPAMLNPVIGRDDTIELIGKALQERPLVTITGPGGIGKTTVAIATATRLASRHDRSIAFVDLSNTLDGDCAVTAIAAAIGLDTEGNVLSAVCERLRTNDFILILDTCEHLVEPASKLVELLLRQCPPLRILVTSREALRADGEWIHRLPSLTYPDNESVVTSRNAMDFSAIALFVDRVRASTRFEPRTNDLSIIARICKRLDGVPLALEFAAARVVDLGLNEIAVNLDDRFSILTRGRRTALPRHQTMSATVQWSYGLLSDDEQKMLRHLATIEGPFTTEHALLVVQKSQSQRPVETLSGLYEKSLLSVDVCNNAPVYRLFDTTRAYIRGLNSPDA